MGLLQLDTDVSLTERLQHFLLGMVRIDFDANQLTMNVARPIFDKLLIENQDAFTINEYEQIQYQGLLTLNLIGSSVLVKTSPLPLPTTKSPETAFSNWYL